MGYSFEELIPPAILLDNPGITKEEFATLYGETESKRYPVTEYPNLYPWANLPPNDKIYLLLEKLASILKLRPAPTSRKFNEDRVDENGFRLLSPRLNIQLDEEEVANTGHRYRVDIHIGNQPHPPKIVKGSGMWPPGIGYIWEDILPKSLEKVSLLKEDLVRFTDGNGEVTKVLRARPAKVIYDPESKTYQPDYYKYTVEITPISKVFQLRWYDTLDEVFLEYPRFRPDCRWDFSQERGDFAGIGCDNFFWLNKEGKYFLDPETFNQIPASFLANKIPSRRSRTRTFGFGYTDLIVTAEAIKYNAWDLTYHYGLRYLDTLAEKIPSLKERYERAVWDSHTSLSAKDKGMSNTEFLRMRLLKSIY